MKKMKHSTIIILSLSLCILAFIIVFLFQNMNFGMADSFSESHAAMSISFDKRAIRSVNKAVIRNDTKQIEIADPDLIGQIVKETAAATHLEPACSEEQWIDLYHDDQLVRSMGWSSCCDTVNVFGTDAPHWVITTEGIFDGGCIYLSADLLEKLETLIDKG